MARKTKREVLADQRAFCACFAEHGVPGISAKLAGVSIETIEAWTKGNIEGFKDKYDQAKVDFKESLHRLILERIKLQKPGDNPTLLVNLLAAHIPEMFGKNNDVSDSTASELMSELKQMFRKTEKLRKSAKETSESKKAVSEAENIIAIKGGENNYSNTG
mgnify:CR=1 FL=1|tara:strand:- start:773 stop:1255 length:483 start_codon:yes stop_codon:yes gene_type:complete